MEIPADYHGREQSFLKHRVLQEYLALWGRKIGSLSRNGPVTLWYVDCFAGPWQSQDEALTDTSIHIGLGALEEAGRIWRENGHEVSLSAVFVEKDPGAYKRLKRYLDEREGLVRTVAFEGEFGQHVDEVAARLGDDPAFVFVDPTGFKGVEMEFIQPLLQKRMREVLVNVMFNHINRFKDDTRGFLRAQMRAFFGLADTELPEGLSEIELLQTYRRNLKRSCSVTYAADLAVPHPTKRRTWFRLVIGGKHPEVLRVFREVESRVVGGEASSIRTAARARKTEAETGQISLLGSHAAPEQDAWYARANEVDQAAVIDDLVALLERRGRTPYEQVWPPLLEERHVTEAELGRQVVLAAKAGRINIEPASSRRQRAKEGDFLSLSARPK
jgi:three-Cys-motif partner protein